MSTERNADRVKLDLSDGYLEALKGALEYNNDIHSEQEEILNRNSELRKDLEYVKDDNTLLTFKSRLPQYIYIYMLVENYVALINECNQTLRELNKTLKDHIKLTEEYIELLLSIDSED